MFMFRFDQALYMYWTFLGYKFYHTLYKNAANVTQKPESW